MDHVTRAPLCLVSVLFSQLEALGGGAKWGGGADRLFMPSPFKNPSGWLIPQPTVITRPEVVSIRLSILQILPTSLFPCFLSLILSSVLFWLPMVPAFCSVVSLISTHDIVNRHFLF